jgi:hypothetical protein
MNHSIILDILSFNHLRRILPAESAAAKAIAQAGIFEKSERFTDGAALIECTEAEARELLAFAEQHCPKAVSAISRSLQRLKVFRDL